MRAFQTRDRARRRPFLAIGAFVLLGFGLPGDGGAQTVRDTTVVVAGRTIHAICAGGSEPGAILLHGAGSRAETFRPMLERWSGDARLCAYDRACHGESIPPPESRAIDDLLGEMWAIHAALGFDRPVVLVGHSMGGLYARALAVRASEDVAGLLLIDPAHEDMRAETRGAMPDSIWLAWGASLERNEDGIDQTELNSELREVALSPMPLTVVTATHRRDTGTDGTQRRWTRPRGSSTRRYWRVGPVAGT